MRRSIQGRVRSLKRRVRVADDELGPVEMAMDHPVAELGTDVVAVAVALVLFLAAQQVGDVDLVLDRHDAVQIPERGLRGGEAERGGIPGVHAQQARDVILRIGEVLVPDQIVDALREERFVRAHRASAFRSAPVTSCQYCCASFSPLRAGALEPLRFLRDHLVIGCARGGDAAWRAERIVRDLAAELEREPVFRRGAAHRFLDAVLEAVERQAAARRAGRRCRA